jgi:hypothetical protein
MEKEIHLEDESGDRKYFTIIPNYILNHSTATAQALYLQLKRLAGENGVAYPASRYLRKQLKISQPTLRKEIKYLLEKGWIEKGEKKSVQTDGGMQEIQTYKIVDLWELNIKHFSKGGEKIDTPTHEKEQRGEKIDTQGVKTRGEKIGTKEELLEEEPSFKKNNSELSSQDSINKVFDVFYNTINPTINYGNTTSRKATKWMVDKWGVDAVVAMAEYACSIHGQPYAPTVTTPYQLKEKLSSLKAFKDKENNSHPKGITI